MLNVVYKYCLQHLLVNSSVSIYLFPYDMIGVVDGHVFVTYVAMCGQ